MIAQADMRRALLDATQPCPKGLTDGLDRPAGRRFDIYRNNVTVSLRAALAEGFPAVHSLIGAENFDHVAGLYLRDNPPNSPLMMQYGDGFPDFLAGFPPLGHLGYLADVARIDLAMRHSYHAADVPAFDVQRLAELDEATLMTVGFSFAPAVRHVTSAWPVVSIWRFATIPDSPKPQASPQTALITRPKFDPEPHPLTPAEAQFVKAMMNGARLGTAIENTDDTFDLGPILHLLLSQNALADILMKDPL